MGGASPGPAVWTDLVSLLLLSPRLVDILSEEGLSGWDSDSVALTGKDGVIVPGYRVLIITGRCGPVVDGRSNKVLKDLPGGQFPVWTGLYFEEATWDGSDFFMPAGHNGHMFATKRAVEAFQRANATGVTFTPLSEVERSMLIPPMP
jgi:hypothetical protein